MNNELPSINKIVDDNAKKIADIFHGEMMKLGAKGTFIVLSHDEIDMLAEKIVNGIMEATDED